MSEQEKIYEESCGCELGDDDLLECCVEGVNCADCIHFIPPPEEFNN